MTIDSKLLGVISYGQTDIITFPGGIPGFCGLKKYILRTSKKTAPICWLVSVEDGSVTFPLLAPRIVAPDYPADKLPIDHETLKVLKAHGIAGLRVMCVLTLPSDLKQMSINLMSPVLINMNEKLGAQFTLKGRQPAKRLIYRELMVYCAGERAC